MNVRVQVALVVGLAVAGATAVASFGAYSVARAEAFSTVDDFLDARGERVSLVIADLEARPDLAADVEPPDEVRGRPGVNRFVEDDAIVAVQLADEVIGEIPDTFFTDSTIDLPEPTATAAAVVTETVVVAGERYRLRSETFASGAVVQIARSLEETDGTLAAIRTRLLLIGVVVTTLAVGAGWIAARRLARPLEELSDAAQRVTATGDLAAPLATAAKGEVGEVSRSFSEMLAVLRESRRQQQQLVVDAGHELRTPLTTLRTNADLLAGGRLDDDDAKRALASIRAEVDELSDLTVELVELAAEAPADPMMRVVDAADVVLSASERASRRHGRKVVVDSVPSTVAGRPAQLDRAVSNLLDNAVKFSPEGSPIEVSVEPGRIEVRDRGPGIEPDDLPHVFDRFFRAPASRTLPGSGLGLAIVAKTAAAHGGEAFARNQDDGGAVVGFTLASATTDHVAED